MQSDAIRIVHTQAASSRWELATAPRAAALAGLVHRAVGYHEVSQAPIARRVLPSSRVLVVFELGSPIQVAARDDGRPLTRFDNGFVAGLDDVAGLTGHDGAQSGLRLELTPEGARRLFGISMAELSGHIVDLADVLPRPLRGRLERLRTMPSWDERFDALMALLQQRLSEAKAQHPGVIWATRRIEESSGMIDVGELVRSLGYSHKHTLRLFREHVGLTPKVLARLVRFERLREAIIRHGRGHLAELAARFGYADQAHLGHEVRHFTGLPPSSLHSSVDVLEQLGAP
jgi:AraC-like DNA-binding protein